MHNFDFVLSLGLVLIPFLMCNKQMQDQNQDLVVLDLGFALTISYVVLVLFLRGRVLILISILMCDEQMRNQDWDRVELDLGRTVAYLVLVLFSHGLLVFMCGEQIEDQDQDRVAVRLWF